MNVEISSQFEERENNDAKKMDVMRSLQSSLESLEDRLDIVTEVVEKYQSDNFSDSEGESEDEDDIVNDEEVIGDEQDEHGKDSISILPIVPPAPPAPAIPFSQASNVSEQRVNMLSQIRSGTTLNKVEPQAKLIITNDLASILRARIEARNNSLNGGSEEDSDGSFDEE